MRFPAHLYTGCWESDRKIKCPVCLHSQSCFQRYSLITIILRPYRTLGLHMRKLKLRGRVRTPKSHSQQVGRAGLEPTPPDSRSGRQHRHRFDSRKKLLSNNVPLGREDRTGEQPLRAPCPPPDAGWRGGRNPRGWLVLMLEECLEKSCLSPLYLTHHLPVSRSVREELP